MGILQKVIALLIANHNLNDNSRLFRYFLSNLAAILGLLLMMTMMCGALLIGVLYTGYLTLLAHGWTTYEALSLLGGVTAVLIAVMGIFLVAHLKKLRHLSRQFPSFQPPPIANKFMNAGQAFMDGLLDRR